MAMTPFEIRLELLKMAEGLLVQSYHTERDTLMAGWHAICDNRKAVGGDAPPLPTLPLFPTEEQIIAKAKNLNEFVSSH